MQHPVHPEELCNQIVCENAHHEAALRVEKRDREEVACARANRHEDDLLEESAPNRTVRHWASVRAHCGMPAKPMCKWLELQEATTTTHNAKSPTRTSTQHQLAHPPAGYNVGLGGMVVVLVLVMKGGGK